jgi:hypothetical protein
LIEELELLQKREEKKKVERGKREELKDVKG